MTRAWPTSNFDKTPLVNTAYPRTDGIEKHYLNPEVIALIQSMFAWEADRVISTVKTLPPGIQAITITTIGDYYWALAANDDNVPESINGLRRAA